MPTLNEMSLQPETETTTETTDTTTPVDTQPTSNPITPTATPQQLERAVSKYLALGSPSKVPSCRVDTDVLLVNVCRGAEALGKPGIEDRIREELPGIDLEVLKDAPRLALALNYVAHKVDPDGPLSSREVADVKQARDLRKSFSRVLAMATEFKVIPKIATKEMFKGNSKAAMAHDLINSVELLAKYEAALKGRTLVDDGMIATARALGTRLLQNADIGSPLVDRPAAEKNAQVHARDVLFARLLKVHDLMRKAAFWLWGAEMGKYVPPLRSAPRAKKGEKVEKAEVKQNPAATTTPTLVPVVDVPFKPVEKPVSANLGATQPAVSEAGPAKNGAIPGCPEAPNGCPQPAPKLSVA
jgi:hypothetical protein